MRLAWARRVLVACPEAADWVAGAVALLVARERFVAGRPLLPEDGAVVAVLGARWRDAESLADLALRLPARAAWALQGLGAPAELWRGEAAWWRRLEADAGALARDPRPGRAPVLAAAALMAVDAHRTVVALETAARGSAPGLLAELRGLA